MTNNSDKPAKKSLVKSGLVLSLMTLASRIMGLVREATKASFLGTSMYADAFATAFMIPNLLRRLFAENAISVAFIPTFKKYLAKGDTPENHTDTQEFLKATFTLVTFLTSCVVVLGIIITPLLVPIFCKKPVDPNAADYAMQLQAWLLKKAPNHTYGVILGLLLGSAVNLFPGFSSIESAGQGFACLFCLIIGAAMAYFSGKLAPSEN